MALRMKWHEWRDRKRADVVAEELLSMQTLEQVRRLHRNHDDDCPLIPLCARQGRCDECGQGWPCATIRILDGGGTDA